jgi:ribosome-binding protein aMBF1 (putative translation factor)
MTGPAARRTRREICPAKRGSRRTAVETANKKNTGPAPEYAPSNRGAQLLIAAMDGRSQRSLARQLCISPTYCNQLLHGDRVPSRSLAVEIEAAFDVPVAAWGEAAE